MTILGAVGVTILLARDCLLQFIQSMSFVQRELGDTGASQRFQMGSASEQLAHVVGNRSHVGAGTDASAKADAVGVDGNNFEFLDFDLHRLEANLFLFASEFVGGNAFDLLR